MFARAEHGIGTARRAFALTLAGVVLLASLPYQAFGAPSASEASATAAQNAAMQADFGTEVADFVAITRELHRTEAEVDQVTKAVELNRAQIAKSRSELASRAVELYRSSESDPLESLLSAKSMRDLISRVNFLTMITSRDALMLKDIRLAETEESWLQESLVLRVGQLQSLQATADKRQAQLLAKLKAQQAQAAAAQTTFAPGADAGQANSVPTGSDPRSRFVRSNVVSDNNFRNGSAMTVGEIQAFLNKQSGVLKSYTGKDHSGATKSAAQMIAQECVRFNVNPKVMLATLQKEQSLLSAKHPTQKQLDWALGAGKADTFTTGSMKGFGNQIYWGAQKFDKNARDWRPGATESVDHKAQVCDNEGTFAQYRYTPHYSGVISFWTIFWRYFGDPLS